MNETSTTGKSKVYYTDFRCKTDEGPVDKLKRLLNLFPDRTGILPTVNKNFFGRSLEHATLRCNMKSSAPC